MTIQIARIYGSIRQPDEFRVLVDRLWPRGVSKERADLDFWAKDIAPSSELRTWFGHKPERFEEFTARYTHELENNAAVPEFLERIKGQRHVTLLYAAKDPAVNHALVLRSYLKSKL